jgi:Omp85 superfamily domain
LLPPIGSLSLIVVRYLFLLSLCLTLSVARAQVSGPPPVADSARVTPPAVKRERPSFIPLPGLFYSPETKLGVAIFIAPVFRIGLDTATRKSTTRLLGYYTQEKQWSIQLEHSLFTPGERYAIIGSWRFYDYPIFYYGTGDQTRKQDEGLVQYKLFTFSERVLKRIGQRRLFFGPQYVLTSLWDIDATKADKLRERPARELQPTVISGAGPVLLLDTRDRLTFPTTGAYAELSATFTGLGGDYSFGRYLADLRRYIPLDHGRGRHVLAAQLVGQFHVGDVPFRELAPLGGISLLRGYYEGRYRGRQLAAAQAEYRFPVWRRFGGVAFAGVGEVGNKVSDFNHPRVAGGAGLRFAFNRQERLNVRADYGIGMEGSSGFYFSIGEAF